MLFANIVLAIPAMSHKFYGTVTINGQPAPDGTTVTAKINGVDVSSTTTSGGNYGDDYSFGVPDPDGIRVGSEIRLFVNNVYSGVSAVFCNACYNLCGTDSVGCAPLNLAVTIPTTTGGASPSGGGASTTTSTTGTTGTTETTSAITETGCQEKWTCSNWGECVNGIQARTCEDENACGTNSREPFASQPCSAEERKEAEASAGPIGFFLLSSTDLAVAAAVGAVASAVIIFLIMRRKPKPVPVVVVG
ncbi:MAG: hypothetical protein V1818_00905 [Candidatus Aenigmatarchaeota archaeon]